MVKMQQKEVYINPLHLMRAIAHVNASTRATGLMRVKNSMPNFCL